VSRVNGTLNAMVGCSVRLAIEFVGYSSELRAPQHFAPLKYGYFATRLWY